MSKRRFRIEGGRYGGEYAVGIVNPDFVRYWEGKDENDLINHLIDLTWDDGEDVDDESPPVISDTERYEGWYEICDFEHASAPYADDDFLITEVTDKKDDWDYDNDPVKVSPSALYSRECYITQTDEPDDEDIDLFDPTLSFHSCEKGTHCVWFVETDGDDFDPKLLTFSTVETDFGEFVENVYYHQEELDANYDFCESNGKGYYVSLGWMHKEYYEPANKYEGKVLEELWEDHNETINDSGN